MLTLLQLTAPLLENSQHVMRNLPKELGGRQSGRISNTTQQQSFSNGLPAGDDSPCGRIKYEVLTEIEEALQVWGGSLRFTFSNYFKKQGSSRTR